MVAAVAQPGSASTSAAEAEGGGGFVSDAGGFLLDEDVVMGGEFLPSGEGEGEPELAAGGFLPEPGEAPFRLDDSEPTAGGFLLDDTDTTAGAGGFILDDSEPAGGFLADPSFDFNAPFPPPLPPFSFDDLSVPDAEPAARIRLKSIPDALAALHLPSDSHDLLALFADAASDDEEGVPSVSRARFVEACSALLGEDSEEAEKEDSDEEESDAYVEDVSHRRTAPRRATRANPLPLVAPLDKGKGRAIEIDDDDDDDEPLVISSSDEESAADSDDELAPAAKGKGKGKATKGKGKAVKVAAPRKLTEEELKEAEDSYELFFEGSAKAGQRQRTIGLGELKNVAALLNEKLSDEDWALTLRRSLHVSQTHLRPGQPQYKASSAVLITELGKLLLSFLLALRDTVNERRLLRRPVHILPSPELYDQAEEVHAKDLYCDDPYDPPTVKKGLLSAQNTLRRRSSAFIPATLDVSLASSFKGKLRFPELARFAWARPVLSPILSEKEASPELLEVKYDETLLWKRRNQTVGGLLLMDIFGGDWWKMGIPAVLFAVQNNLIYVAARNLSVPVFQITFQLKTLITAVAAVVMLGRRLALTQWLSLVFLGLGVATMQIGALHAKADTRAHTLRPAIDRDDQNYLAGISSILVSCVCSSVAATYFELVIKRRPDTPRLTAIAGRRRTTTNDNKPASLWIRNIQLSLFSTVFGIIVVLVQANPAHWAGSTGFSLDMNDPMEHWYDPVVRTAVGFFVGFHPMAWLVVFLQTVGGLLIAVAIKHADNVAKGFALSVSIVFTFLLSVILFDFQLTLPSVLGGLAVVGSTLLFEMDDSVLRGVFSSDPYGRKQPAKPLIRGYQYGLLVALAVTFTVAIFPFKRFSVTTAAWELVHSRIDHFAARELPSIAIADMKAINELMTSAGKKCGWAAKPHRSSTLAPYGKPHAMARDFPYYVTNTDQYSLDDILATRFIDYSHSVPLLDTPSPDFIYLPIMSQMYSNPWGCQEPDLVEAIKQTTNYIRQIVATVGPTEYPRIILPVATIRSNLEKELFLPELMEELKDSVVVVSIEGAPKSYMEGMKYMLDVPYPTSFHLSEVATPKSAPAASGVDAVKIRKEKGPLSFYFVDQERPYLVHYAAAASHPWGLPASDPFNGFALRAALQKQFSEFLASPPAGSTTRVIFDDIKDAIDGAQNLTEIHEHMQSAVFCPMPAGDSPTRRAIYEAVLLGCIPVIFREKSYGRLFPSSPDINDVSKYMVYIDENDIINGEGDSLIKRLERIPDRDIERMQLHIQTIASRMQWGVANEDRAFPVVAQSQTAVPIPEGVARWNLTESLAVKASKVPIPDAFSSLLAELEMIKSGEWVAQVVRDTRRGMAPKHFGTWRTTAVPL
ncbi:hypothetical protein RQP46_007011 [Phenoliferia psychrophenolica]